LNFTDSNEQNHTVAILNLTKVITTLFGHLMGTCASNVGVSNPDNESVRK